METARLTDALAFAFAAHDGQTRKGTDVPYISHPLGVASLVMEAGGSDDEVVAALLHDAVEDGGEELIEPIRETFGERVIDIVLECSDAVVPKGADKPGWWERKRAYIERVPQESSGAVLVTTADKVHNARAIVSDLREIGDEVFARFTAGKDGALWYQRAITEALERNPHTPRRLLVELRSALDEIERLAASG
ncbi:MAG: HD domain-containing protein [Actinomycetota bacterium]